MNRIGPDDSTPPDVAALEFLRRAGWSIGDVGLTDASGRPTWLVIDSDGENLIRAERSTPTEAWGRVIGLVRWLRMPGRP